VHDQGISLGNLLQDVARPATGIHEVLGDNLEPIHSRLVLEDVRKMHGPQAETETKVWVSESLWSHG
jgi:hypothetical protein